MRLNLVEIFYYKHEGGVTMAKQSYISAIVQGIVKEVKTFGKLNVVKLTQGNFDSEVKLGNGVKIPELGIAVSYKGTVKMTEKFGIEFWANEVMA